METDRNNVARPKGGGNPRGGVMPVFADQDTIRQLFGVPEGTLRTLAREMVVACHKLGSEQRAKTVYFCEDVENWVAAQGAPDWVRNAAR